MISERALPHASLTRSPLPIGNYGWLKWGLQPGPAFSEPELRELALAMTSEVALDHEDLPAGYTYFGQLLDHDLSFQSAAFGERSKDPDALVNFRTPAFDLDCVYGRGPRDQPYLYWLDPPVKLLTGRVGKQQIDLLRTPGGIALAGDPRNDEQLLVAHFHLMLIEVHNRFVDELYEQGESGARLFERARTLTTWHYQWVVLYDYLRRVLAPEVYERLLGIALDQGKPRGRGLRHYVPATRPYLPHEFVGAAFRFGHSMVRAGYKLNAKLHAARKGALIPPFGDDGDDLRGGRPPLMGWRVEPAFFLDLGDPSYQRSQRIGPRLCEPLGRMPIGHAMESLAFLDLKRGQDLGLPSGQALAVALGIDPPPPRSGGLAPTNGCEIPLWYYVLREAEEQQRGLRLGELGSTLVGEVMVGALLYDPASFLNRAPGWQPTLSATGDFGLGDLARFAWRIKAAP